MGWILRSLVGTACFGAVNVALSTESDVLFSAGSQKSDAPEGVVQEAGGATWSYSPSGESVYLLHTPDLPTAKSSYLSIQHSAFPASSLSSSDTSVDHRLGVNYRTELSDIGFLESRSMIDDSNFGPYSPGYRQVVGYGLRIVDRRTVTFDIIPGVLGDYSVDRPIEERLKLMGNLNQNLSWAVSDGFVVTQNFNTTLERTEDNDLSAVLNLDLETLFAERLSFKLSYEVHYDDSLGDDLEKRDSRLSTSVGFRF
tara:strand:- start:6378 stop:7142 length:765 start_codon:yes stop_codon:yes gene_type:complete